MVKKKRNKFITILLTCSIVIGAFFMQSSRAFASSGEGGVMVEIPEGWQIRERSCQVKAYEYSTYNKWGKETKVVADKVSVAFEDGAYVDITNSMQVTISQNGTLKVKVEYPDGNSLVEKIEVTNFDLEKPTLTAEVKGEYLYLSAKDEISGVYEIIVNGRSYRELTDGCMCISLKTVEESLESFVVYTKDTAGNNSKRYKIPNPYYVGEKEAGTVDEGIANPDSIEKTEPTDAKGTVTEMSVNTEGEEVTKEFYTIDADGKVFYLVVDKTISQDNVFLLTEVGVNDLLNFVDYNGVDVENGKVPLYEIEGEVINEPEEAVTEEAAEEKEVTDVPKEKGSSALMIILIVAGAGTGIYFYRNKKRRDEYLDAEEMDAFTAPEEDEEEEEELDEEESDEEKFFDEEEADNTELEEISVVNLSDDGEEVLFREKLDT